MWSGSDNERPRGFEQTRFRDLTKEERKEYLAKVMGFVTALFAGLTVWSINGTITIINHHSNEYGSWD